MDTFQTSSPMFSRHTATSFFLLALFTLFTQVLSSPIVTEDHYPTLERRKGGGGRGGGGGGGGRSRGGKGKSGKGAGGKAYASGGAITGYVVAAAFIGIIFWLIWASWRQKRAPKKPKQLELQKDTEDETTRSLTSAAEEDMVISAPIIENKHHV